MILRLWGEITCWYSHQSLSTQQTPNIFINHSSHNINSSSIITEQQQGTSSSWWPDLSSSPVSLHGLLSLGLCSVQCCIVWSWLMIAIVRFCHHLINPDISKTKQQGGLSVWWPWGQRFCFFRVNTVLHPSPRIYRSVNTKHSLLKVQNTQRVKWTNDGRTDNNSHAKTTDTPS